MKRLLASLVIAAVAVARPGPAQASEGGRDPVELAVSRIALSLTMSQILFTPTQIILLAGGGAYGVVPGDVERIEEPSGGGLFAKLFEANRRKVFAELARKNFLNKVGRAYKIGNMVFIDSMFFDSEFDDEVTAAGREALRQILGGGTFALGQLRDPFEALLQQQILAMMFFMRATQGMRIVYRLDPKMGEAGGIEGAQAGAALRHPLAFLAFFAAVASGEARPIGDVWQIGDKVVISAPLDEVFDERPE